MAATQANQAQTQCEALEAQRAMEAQQAAEAAKQHANKCFKEWSQRLLGIVQRAFRLIDRNRIPSFIAFCATAPGVRRSFLAA